MAAALREIAAPDLNTLIAKLLEAHAGLEEQLAKAPAGTIEPALLCKARWSCESLGDRLALAKFRWIGSRRAR